MVFCLSLALSVGLLMSLYHCINGRSEVLSLNPVLIDVLPATLVNSVVACLQGLLSC